MHDPCFQNTGKEELQREVAQLNKELKGLQGKLDAATKEVQQQKQVRGWVGWESACPLQGCSPSW
jgi:hypothetical protein